MAEKDFQNEIAASIKAYGQGLYFKIPDTPVSHFGHKAGSFQGHTRPFDCFWCWKNKFIAMELKQIRALSMNIGEKGALRQHQEEALLHLDYLNTQSDARPYTPLVLVNFQTKLSAKMAQKLGQQTLDEAYAINIRDLVAARTELCSDSVPISFFQQQGVQLLPYTHNGGRRWNLNPLFHYAKLSEPEGILS